MSTTLEDLETLIASSMANPNRVQVGDMSVSKPSISELIAAAKFLSGSSGTKDFAKAFTRMKIVPPGIE